MPTRSEQETRRIVTGILWDSFGGDWNDLKTVTDIVIDELKKGNIPDARTPKQCPRCKNWCIYDGWDHVHANGIGIGSCRPQPPDGWFTFGSHVNWDGQLEFSNEVGPDGFPEWERPLPIVSKDREPHDPMSL